MTTTLHLLPNLPVKVPEPPTLALLCIFMSIGFAHHLFRWMRGSASFLSQIETKQLKGTNQ